MALEKLKGAVALVGGGEVAERSRVLQLRENIRKQKIFQVCPPPIQDNHLKKS